MVVNSEPRASVRGALAGSIALVAFFRFDRRLRAVGPVEAARFLLLGGVIPDRIIVKSTGLAPPADALVAGRGAVRYAAKAAGSTS